jgi:hypothetical protein
VGSSLGIPSADERRRDVAAPRFTPPGGIKVGIKLNIVNIKAWHLAGRSLIIQLLVPPAFDCGAYIKKCDDDRSGLRDFSSKYSTFTLTLPGAGWIISKQRRDTLRSARAMFQAQKAFGAAKGPRVGTHLV